MRRLVLYTPNAIQNNSITCLYIQHEDLLAYILITGGQGAFWKTRFHLGGILNYGQQQQGRHGGLRPTGYAFCHPAAINFFNSFTAFT